MSDGPIEGIGGATPHGSSGSGATGPIEGIGGATPAASTPPASSTPPAGRPSGAAVPPPENLGLGAARPAEGQLPLEPEQMSSGHVAAAPVAPADVPFWQKIPKKFLIYGLIAAVVLGVGAIQSIGSTNADDLGVGDCFKVPEIGEEFKSVDDQPCDGPHEAQIFATSPEAIADNRCFDEFIKLPLEKIDSLPDDADMSIITDPEGGLAQCVIFSESGSLTESVLP